MRSSVEYVLGQLRATVDAVPEDGLERLAGLVRASRNVFLFGRGRSGLVARALAIRLVHLGIRAFVVGESITPPVGAGDLVLLFSGTGETFSVTLTAEIAKRQGARIAAITAEPDASLARLATTVVVLPVPRGPEQARLAPLGTLFEHAALLVSDALVAQLMQGLGETEASMRKRHATLE